MVMITLKHCYKKLLHYGFKCIEHTKGAHEWAKFAKDDITIHIYNDYREQTKVFSMLCLINGEKIAHTLGDDNPSSSDQRYMFKGFGHEQFLNIVCKGKSNEVLEAFRENDVERTLKLLP
jgi:hypothetical protein